MSETGDLLVENSPQEEAGLSSCFVTFLLVLFVVILFGMMQAGREGRGTSLIVLEHGEKKDKPNRETTMMRGMMEHTQKPTRLDDREPTVPIANPEPEPRLVPV